MPASFFFGSFVLPQACAQHPTYAGYAFYSGIFSYSSLSETAHTCGHPASTVKATPPALNTCEGARVKFTDLTERKCAPDIHGTGEQTPDSCGNAECAELISSIDDDALANMKTGLQV